MTKNKSGSLKIAILREQPNSPDLIFRNAAATRENDRKKSRPAIARENDNPRIRTDPVPLKDSSDEDRLDWIFQALSDRTRRHLLGQLSRGPAMVTELAKPFDLSLPAVSRHIKVLERAHLIVRAVDGRVHRCSPDAEALQTAEAWIERYRHFWEGTLESLARYVEEPEDREHESGEARKHER